MMLINLLRHKYKLFAVLVLSIQVYIWLKNMTFLTLNFRLGHKKYDSDFAKLIQPANISTHQLKHSLENLLKNPIYKRFNIKKPISKKNVTLLLIVSSGPRRGDRRNAIRATWWKQCVPTGEVIPECIFITDNQTKNDSFYDEIREEEKVFGDVRYQSLKGGIEFGMRFLYHLVWAKTHYNFDFFMRIDDDYLLCMERFLHEIPIGAHNFHWGFSHQGPEQSLTRPEESIIMLSTDVVELFLAQDPYDLLCHPLADQMIASWINKFPHMQTLLRHDKRLHHDPPVDESHDLNIKEGICGKYIGIHGCYSHNMRDLWQRRGSFKFKFNNKKERNDKIGNLLTNSKVCVMYSPFDWRNFEIFWRHEPKYCIDKPKWNTALTVKGGTYMGREETPDVKKWSFFRMFF